MTIHVSHAAARPGFWHAPFEALRDGWQRYRIYNRTYAELSALSTRDLDDLGISRSMISRLALEAAYGRSA